MSHLSLIRSLIRRTLLEGRIDDLKAKYADIDVDAVAARDPSSNKKLLPWMLKQLEMGAAEEDLYPTVAFFNTNAHRFKSKDIFAYKTLKELEDESKRVASSGPSKTQEKTAAKSEAPKLFEDERFLVVRPETKRACVSWGKGTKWCITMESASYWEQYTGANVVFYFFIDKKAQQKSPMSRVAAAVMRDRENAVTKIELYDAEDEQISAAKFSKRYPKTLLTLATSDAAKRPKGIMAKLKDGDYEASELVAYWKTLGNEQQPKIAALIQVGEKNALSAARALLGVEKDEQLRDILADVVDGTAEVRYDSIEWRTNGELHRDDGPAVIGSDGSQAWYQNGDPHRDDGPAVIGSDGTQEWHQNGELHRDDGPATLRLDGTQAWYQHGKLHRDDGPAIWWPDGTQYWYRNGKRVKSHVS